MNQELQDYIKKSKEIGINDEQIKQELLKAGWQEQDINLALTGPVLIQEPNKESGLKQFEQKKHSKLTTIVLVVVPIILIIAGGAIAYNYLLRPLGNKIINQEINKTNEEQKNVQKEDAQTLQKTSPKETYLKIKAAADNLKTYADFEAYTLKYGSKRIIEEMNANQAQVDTLPESFKQGIVDMMQQGVPALNEITNIQESINGNIATLIVSANNSNLKGTITLVLEDNQWKLDLESWKESLPK